MLDELLEIAAGVRDQAELEVMATKLFEDGKRILVELEVLGSLPEQRHLDGTFAGAARVAAHPEDDSLRERDPDLVVVLELGVALEIVDRGAARIFVARGVEDDSEALAETPVSLGAEIRPGLGEREVDVEEDGAQLHAAFRSHRHVSTWSAW